MAMVKRNIALPDFAPTTRQTGLPGDLEALAIGESGIVASHQSAVKQAAKRLVAKLSEVNDVRIFAVWPSNSDGSAVETGAKFSLVARIDEETAAKYEAQRPGSTIRA